MAQTEIILAVFLGITLLASIVSKRIKAPYTTLLVLVGLILSALPALPGSVFAGIVGSVSGLVSGNLFIGLILPPILFESIMSFKSSDFQAVYRPALLLATVGVAISTVVVGVILWKVVGLDPYVSFFFAALISPTDVATVLEIFGRIEVPSRLATLVDMESIFNDATAIAIFSVVLASAAEATLRPFDAFVQFVYVLGGGTLVGLGIAWGARQVQKEVYDSVTQVVLTLVAVYGAYGVAQGLGTSGLIAVATTGLFYGSSAKLSMGGSTVAQVTSEFWKVLAFVANAVAFFYIGVATNISLLVTSFGAVLVAYGVVMMARITSVYPIMSLTKVQGAVVPASWMNVAALGGMRGALAIVLVSVVPTSSQGPVATLAFGVVMLSILVQGPLLSNYARRRFGQQTLPVEPEKSPPPPPEEKGGEPQPEKPLTPEPEAGKQDAVR